MTDISAATSQVLAFARLIVKDPLKAARLVHCLWTSRHVDQDRAVRAEAALARVRELHQPYGGEPGVDPYCGICAECEETAPCPTIRALDGDAT